MSTRIEWPIWSIRVTENSLPSITFQTWKRDANRETSKNFFTIFFIYICKEKKKERKGKRWKYLRSRKENLLFSKRKKKTEISQTQISLHSMSNEFDVTNLLFPCKILDSLFLDIPISRVSRSNKQRCFSSNFSREGNRKIKKNPDRVYFEIFLLRFFSRSQNTVIKTVSASVRSLLLSFTFIIKCINILRKCYFFWIRRGERAIHQLRILVHESLTDLNGGTDEIHDRKVS